MAVNAGLTMNSNLNVGSNVVQFTNGNLDATGAAGLHFAGARVCTAGLAVAGCNTHTGPVTRSYVVSPTAYQPDNDQILFDRFGGGIWGRQTGAFVQFLAPVNLPDGAVITQVVMHFRDHSASQDITMRLAYHPFGMATFVIASLASVGAPGDQSLAAGLNFVVDNDAYSLFVDGFWTVPGDAFTGGVAMEDVVIRYQVQQALP